LRVLEPVTLLLTSEVADVPADAVHRQKPPLPLFIGDAFNAAHELASRETQLLDEWVDH
jgi:hypothetical protein